MTTARPARLTLEQARRVAVRAQRLDRPRQTPPLALLRHLGAIQIDSVNVLARAHYLPFFSRGLAKQTSVDGLFNSTDTTEYWAHEASLLAAEDRALFAWRMRDWRDHAWSNARRMADDHPQVLEMVAAEAAAEPGTAREIELRLEATQPRTRSSWGWNWSLVKRACEALFWSGRLSTTGRNRQFERVFVEGAIPDTDDAAASRALVERAVRASGVASRRTIRDYFRLSPAIVDLGLREALSAGTVEPVEVSGTLWYATPDLAIPRVDSGTALLAPFDPLLWDRDRVERLFDFRYRLEIYTPEAKRQYGYYVLPFLLDGHLVARVDLKADRQAGLLRVRSAWGDERAAQPLREELLRLSRWLGLSGVEVEPRGDLRL